VGDRLLMLENAWYSVISPENCSAILWRSWDYKEDAARALKLTAPDLVEQGIVDDVIAEPLGGAHRDPKATSDAMGVAIATHLNQLTKLSAEELIEQRIAKYDAMGPFETV
jgi:acetyl-CoA carboxylase carboxyl transferase subunit alpha